jgi:ABC-type nitrate/sulfonate/bicarbonate transport system permease component
MSERVFPRRSSLFVVCVLVWQGLTSAAHNRYFPTPLAIARAAARVWIAHDILSSLGRIALGWGIAAVIGVAAGLALGRSPAVTDYCRGLLAFARAVPPPVLVPLFFHRGQTMEVLAIAVGSVWPVLLNAADGARSIDPVTMNVALIYRVPWYHRVIGVIVPAAAPKVFAGLRISLSVAFILMIIAELVSGGSGIGYRLRFAQGDLPGLWAWLVLVGALAYVCTGLLAVVERRVLRFSPP